MNKERIEPDNFAHERGVELARNLIHLDGIMPGMNRVNSASTTDTLRTAYQQFKGYLEIGKLTDIPEINDDTRDILKERFNILIANQYNLDLLKFDLLLQRYSQFADSVIDFIVRDLPENDRVQGEESPIRSITHPIDLMIASVMIDDPKDRFRALRKLRLLELAAKIDSRANALNIHDSRDQLNQFIVSSILEEPLPENERQCYLLSYHNLEDGNFSTITSDDGKTPTIFSIAELSERHIQIEGDEVWGVRHGQKLLPVTKYQFRPSDAANPIDIYFPGRGIANIIRKKSISSMIIKSLRRDMNPTQAIVDYLGFMPIFKSEKDLDSFNKHFISKAIEVGSGIKYRGVENTLEGGERRVNPRGGTSKLNVYKAHIEFWGTELEMIGLTPNAAAEFFYGTNAHRRYELKRTFENIMPRLFPQNVFPDFDIDNGFRIASAAVEVEIRDQFKMALAA